MTHQVPILLYHRVTAEVGPKGLSRYRVTPTAFEAQLRFLRQNGYYPIGSDELHAAMRSGLPFRGRPIMLTFDDGYSDFFTNAWPLLRRYDFFAEVFIVTEKVGREADWDTEYGEPAPLMPWETIRELAAGGIRFGSHLATHTRVEMLSEDELLREARDSRTALESMLSREIRSIALPHGGGDDVTFQLLERCGYQVEYGTLEGLASISAPPMGLPRIEIRNTDDVASFARKIGREAQGRVAVLEAAVVDSDQRANQLAEMLDERTRQLTDAHGKMAALEAAVVDSDQRANQLAEMLDERTRQLTDAHGKMAALEAAVVDSNRRVCQLAGMLDERTRQLTEAQGKVAALETAMVDSNQRANQLGGTLKERTDEVAGARETIARIENSLT